MKCADIPTFPILKFLSEIDYPATWHEHQGRPWEKPTVRDAMPDGTPDKLILAKMRKLIKAGLVDGCYCGCYGYFQLEAKGYDKLKEMLTEAKNGV